MNWKKLDPDNVDWIVVHHTATRPNQDIGAAEIRQMHRDRGWLDIGYHFVVRRNGSIELGRPVTAMGAHVKNFNATSLGIAVVGGLDAEGNVTDQFPKEQIAALDGLIDLLKVAYWEAEVVRHNDLAETLCNRVPSKHLRKLTTER